MRKTDKGKPSSDAGIRTEQSALLQLLAGALFAAPLRFSEEPDWERLMQEASQQAVLPLAFEAAKDLLPAEPAAALQEPVDDALVSNLCKEYEHIELHRAMEEAGIPYVVMKGSASAAYYPQPMLRMMGDVDFLVRREDAERAGGVLEKLGFRATGDRTNPIHQSYVREDPAQRAEWELHWSPNGIPRNEAGERIRALLGDSIESAVLRETENGCYRVPDAFHHGLMLLIHTAMHLMHSGVGLRHLCDWAVFAAGFSEEEFRGIFEEKLRSAGLWDFAAVLTALSVRWLGCPDPGWTGLRDPELLDGLLCDILNGGNFGKKDRERLNQAKLMVDRSEGALHRGKGLRNLISALNVKARRSMPALRRFPFLLPVAWLKVVLQHMGRVLLGRRPSLRLGRMLEGAKERGELYAQLRIFEQAGDE